MIYYYSEGMAAPMGNFQNYRRVPRAVKVVDRSLREEARGLLDDGETAEGRRLQRFAALGFTARGPLFRSRGEVESRDQAGAKDGAPDRVFE